MRAIMTTLLVATLLAGSGRAQDWQKDLDTANRLLAAGYHDAAQEDFEAILRKYEANPVAVSRGWLGLAQVHTGKSEPDLAKSSLEEVLKLNADPPSAGEARGMYGQLAQQAQFQVQQAGMALQFMEYRYYSIPWYNVLAKAFTYYDLRSVKQNYEKAQAHANGFNPRYLIAADGAPPARGSGTAGGSTPGTGVGPGTLPATGTPPSGAAGSNIATSGHVPAGGAPGVTPSASAGNRPPASDLLPGTGNPIGGIPTGGTPVELPGESPAPGTALPPVVADATAPAPSPVADVTAAPPSLPPVVAVSAVPPTPKPDVTAKPSPAPAERASETAPAQDLSQLQSAYQNAYRELQSAMQSGDPAKIRETSGRYQSALRAYRDEAFKNAR